MTTRKRKEGKRSPKLSFERIDDALRSIGAEKLTSDDLKVRHEETIKVLKAAYYVPQGPETAAVAIGIEKTAALFYDRVWSPFPSLVPYSFHFCGASEDEYEHLANIIHTLRKEDKQSLPDEEFISFFHKKMSDGVSATYEITDEGKLKEVEKKTIQRGIADFFWTDHKVNVVPIYTSQDKQDLEYSYGDKKVVVSVLSNLEIPVEKELSWEQVEELRKDIDARLKCRRLLHWLDKDMVGKSASYISDHIAVALDEYQRSLRKHGIRTALSTVAGTFSAVSVPAVVSHLVQQPFWVSLLQGLLIGGGTIAKVIEGYINAKPREADEIAWVYEMKKRL